MRVFPKSLPGSVVFAKQFCLPGALQTFSLILLSLLRCDLLYTCIALFLTIALPQSVSMLPTPLWRTATSASRESHTSCLRQCTLQSDVLLKLESLSSTSFQTYLRALSVKVEWNLSCSFSGYAAFGSTTGSQIIYSVSLPILNLMHSCTFDSWVLKELVQRTESP